MLGNQQVSARTARDNQDLAWLAIELESNGSPTGLAIDRAVYVLSAYGYAATDERGTGRARSVRCARGCTVVDARPQPLVKSVQIALGDYHTCALTTAGAVECWGSNE